MFHKTIIIKSLLILLTSTFLSACGNKDSIETINIPVMNLNGASTGSVCTLSSSDGTKGTTITDSNGQGIINMSLDSTKYLMTLVCIDGTYTDEATGIPNVEAPRGEAIELNYAAGETIVASPLSTEIVKAAYRNGGLSREQLITENADLITRFSLPVGTEISNFNPEGSGLKFLQVAMSIVSQLAMEGANSNPTTPEEVASAATELNLSAVLLTSSQAALSTLVDNNVVTVVDAQPFGYNEDLHPKEDISLSINDNQDGIVRQGETITYTFTFTKAITGFASDDIHVINGSKSQFTAINESEYNLVVIPTTNANNTISISVEADVVEDTHGNGNTAASSTQLVDTQKPSVTITDDTAGTVVAGGTIIYTFTFGEAVTGFTADDIQVSNGSKGSFTEVSATEYTLVVTPSNQLEGNVVVSVNTDSTTDTAGNGNTAASSTQLVDTQKPSVTITDSAAGTVIAGETITYTFTFDEAVTGFTADDIQVNNGSKGNLTSISTSQYTLVVTPSSQLEGSLTVSVNADVLSDIAGNGNIISAVNTQLIDTNQPTIVITDDKQNVVKKGETVNYTFTFDQDITGFTTSDIQVTNGTKGGFAIISATQYTLLVTPTDDLEDDLTVSINAGLALDSSGNGNTASTSIQTFDTLNPTITALTISDDNLVNGDDNLLAVGLNGRTTGVENGQILSIVVGATSSQVTVNNNLFSGIINLSSIDDGLSISSSLNVADQAGNSASAFTSTFAKDRALTFKLNTDTGRSAFDGVTSNGSVDVTNLDSTLSWNYSTDAGVNYVAGTGTSFTLATASYAPADIKVYQDISAIVSNTATIIIDPNEKHLGTITSITFNGAHSVTNVPNPTVQIGGYGGLSGMDYNIVTDSWDIVTDSKTDSRIIQSSSTLNNNNLLTFAWTGNENTIDLQSLGTPDAESIRTWVEDGVTTYFITSEGLSGTNPRIFEVDDQGVILQEFTIPNDYLYTEDPNSGMRNNAAFEGMTLSPDGTRLYAMTEKPLIQDGAAATFAAGGINTIVEFERTTGTILRTHKYLTDTISPVENLSGFAPATTSFLGVSEILSLDDNTLIILERAIASKSGFGVKVFQVDLPAYAVAETATPIAKTELVNLQQSWNGLFGLPTLTLNGQPTGVSLLQNIEGMSWGKNTSANSRQLILMNDNNYSNNQGLQIWEFDITGTTP